jgi:hypothetical protein
VVLDVVDHLGGRRDHAAERRERFAERARDDVHVVHDVVQLAGAATRGAHGAEAVGVVHDQARAVLLLESDELGQGREITLHREHAVGDDRRVLVLGDPGEDGLAVLGVEVVVAPHAALADHHPLVDGGMVLAVEDRDVVPLEDRAERREVRLVAGGHHGRGGFLEERGEATL